MRSRSETFITDDIPVAVLSRERDYARELDQFGSAAARPNICLWWRHSPPS